MFSKDILLIDIETTGLDTKKHELIQLAAVLLDKKTLKEKKAFSSYVRPRTWQTRMKEAMEVNKISYDEVKSAPNVKEVITAFAATFNPKKVILANYGGVLDINFLRKAYEDAHIPYRFDYHIFNLWPLCYTYLAQSKFNFKNKKKFAGFGLEDLVKKFKLETQTHDALDDCRLEAEILRKILMQL